MMTTPSSNKLELDSNPLMLMIHKTSTTFKPRSNSLDSSLSSDDTLPTMVMSASLQSVSECDNDSLSSSFSSRSSLLSSSPTSPRSIFSRYWSSPTHKNSLLEKDDEDEVLARLSTLLPSMNDDENDSDEAGRSAKVVHQAPIVQSIEQKTSFDDASIDYQPPQPKMRTPRRQILPTPPPSTSVSSSLIMPRHQLRRNWCSTSALMKGPNQSCLRKARYSCSVIAGTSGETSAARAEMSSRLHHNLRNNGHLDLHTQGSGRRPRADSDIRDELKKSVSFYSQVSVFEFAVPPDQRRSQKGWSKYFA